MSSGSESPGKEVFLDSVESTGPLSEGSTATPLATPDLDRILAKFGSSPLALLREPDDLKALFLIFEDLTQRDRQSIKDGLGVVIATIDDIVSRVVDSVLHHPKFQKLEASWRGVEYLIAQVDDHDVPDGRIVIRAFNASWAELRRDFEHAVEFDQTVAFQQIYEAEYGIAGGKPYGVLIGNYELRPHPDDYFVIKEMSGVAAASFSPFIMGVTPEFLGVEEFSDLESVRNLGSIFDRKEYTEWRSFRESEDSRYVGLAMPRVLMRLPYKDDGSHDFGFRYRERVGGPNLNKYLWGNAAFAFGEVLIRCFANSNWLADIRGVQQGVEAGGIVTGLPVHHFGTDAWGVTPKSSTDLSVTDVMERQLSDIGLLPLSSCHDTEFSAFYSNESAQSVKHYSTPEATQNARISKMLQYMFCSSRFAHYLKTLARWHVGSFTDAGDLESLLHNWIMDYVMATSDISREQRARFPLRDAEIRVRPQLSDSGHFLTSIRLVPHLEVDDLQASVQLKTKITPS